jgi:predicted CXXCH cytochrome family protein
MRGARAAVLLLAFALAMLGVVSSAFANFGPHIPGDSLDTDSCAMCHRTHTSFSSATWSSGPSGEYANALLVGSSGTVTEFCLACHGEGAPGAATNVIDGIFESSSAYVTSSTPNAPLNAGGFGSMPDPYAWNASASVDIVPTTSRHELDTGPLPLWGAGTTLATTPGITCTSCHDPHPTSNYRMLKGSINATTVGGYAGSDAETPNAFVFSTETGFPVPGVDASNTAGGFLKGEAGIAQVEGYRPNYTGGSNLLNITSTEPNKSLSVWCTSCHTGYRETSAQTTVVVNYEIYEANPNTGGQVGALARHFHPVDVTLENGYGPDRSLPATVEPDQQWVPLEQAQGSTGEFYKNYIGCLTCHRAHGSSTVMTGWAASHLETNTLNYWTPVQDNVPGINPAKEVPGGSPAVGSSALIRTNNRGVCERCHGGY